MSVEKKQIDKRDGRPEYGKLKIGQISDKAKGKRQ